MIQVKTFLLPKQQDAANEFLATHKPQENQVHFNTNMIFVYYDDGVFPLEYERDMWNEYLPPIRNQRQDTEIAIAVLKMDLANARDLKDNELVKNIENQIEQLKNQIENREFKVRFIANKIADLDEKIKKRDQK